MFMFDLELDGLTDEVGHAVAADCDTADAWPVAFVPGRVERRWFGIEKAYPTVLEIQATDHDGSILDPAAERDADVVVFRPGAGSRLAETLRIVARHFPGGFGFIATHSGSPIQKERSMTVDEVAGLAADSRLNEFTRYRVAPGRPA